MEYIGCDCLEDIGERKVGPEGTACSKTLFLKCWCLYPKCIDQFEDTLGPQGITKWNLPCMIQEQHFPAFLLGDGTLRASIFLGAANSSLLRRIGDIARQDWMDTSDPTITACHLHPFNTSLDEWPDHLRHTIMEELLTRSCYTPLTWVNLEQQRSL